MEKTDSNKKTARIAGVLLISAIIAGILSIAPSIDAPDYLTKASSNVYQVVIGAIFQFIIAVIYVGIAITLYPVLKKSNENLALGFLSFRIISAVFLILGVVAMLLLLALSQEYVKASVSNSSYFQIFGSLLKYGRDLVNHVAMPLAYCTSCFMFYILLYNTTLIPKWLSFWGLIATMSGIFATLLIMFHLVEIITPTYIGLTIPVALHEIVLAFWLIAKGFNQNVIDLK